MGPQAMRDKLKSNMLDNSRTEAAQKKQPVTQKQTEKDDDEYSNGSFEQDENDAGTGEDQLERLRKAMNKEKEKALKYISEKPVTSTVSTGGVHVGSGQGPKIATHGAASNLDSFAKNRGLIVGERVDHVAANQ
jgi:hypothetical protein